VQGSICVLFGLLSTGCSFLFVQAPPANARKLPPSEPLVCTTSKAAPTIDALVTGFQVIRTVYAMNADNGDYSGFPISRTADIVLGAALTTTFLVSSMYVYATTGECVDA
jgi:hypothetical protein